MSSASPRRIAVLLTALLVLTVPGAATAIHPDTAPTPDPPTFPVETVTEHSGDVVRIPVEVNGSATLGIESANRTNASFAATLRVRDGDGNGRIEVAFATLPGDAGGSQFTAVDPADSVAVEDATPLPNGLPAGEYDLWVASADGSRVTDRARLQVWHARVWDLSVLVAPRTVDDLRSRAAIRAARENGTVTRRAAVAMNDTLILRVEASGIGSAVASGDNATHGFFRAVEGPSADLLVTETSLTPEEEGQVLDLTDYRATRVVADRGNDTYYLVVNTSRLRAQDPGQIRIDRVGMETYEVRFSLNESRAIPPASATSELKIVRRATPFEKSFLEPAPNQTLVGRTNLAPGSPITVTIDTPVDPAKSRTVRVRDDGRFVARFDLSDVRNGTEATVRLSSGGRRVMEFRIEVESAHASVSLPERVDDDWYDLRVRNVTLSQGGFVVLKRSNGEVIGRSERLTAGHHGEVVIAPLVPMEGNGSVTITAVPYLSPDRPYPEATNDSATYDLGTPSPTATATSTETPTAATRAWTETPTPPVTESPVGQGQPGFGIPVALLALVVFLLARRR